jgi:ribonuclease Y
VDVIVDDTPQAVVLSSFDPIRREVAKITLLKLVEDGRIQPARIEEMYYQSKAEIEEHILQAGEQAVFEANCGEFHEEIVKLLGRLNYRTSYGQNVLKHTLEVVHLVGPDGDRARRERQDREARGDPARRRQGGHARGRGLTRGDLDAVRAALRRVAGRHPRGRGASLRGAAADGRGGAPDRRGRDLGRAPRSARRQPRELHQAPRGARGPGHEANGVEKVYALQAGREIRVIVKPGEVDDDQAALLSHEIAREIEHELEYPGPDQGHGHPRVAGDRIREIAR